MNEEEAKAVGEAIKKGEYCVEGYPVSATSDWEAVWNDIFTGSLEACRGFVRGAQDMRNMDSYYVNFRVVLQVYGHLPIVVEPEEE